MSQTEEIKARLDVVDLIREYIQVKAVGANFQALCPFHREKTPSFIVSPEKQIWHCFGCGKGGDIFSFVMEIEGVDFKEALRIIAPKAGVILKQESSENYSRRRRLLVLLKIATDYYARLLNQDVAGADCREYLFKRGLNKDTLRIWSIGYSRDTWEDTLNYCRSQSLAGRKFSDQEIFSAGLSVKKEGGNSYFDRFRGRIMFPIKDQNGQVIAFTARLDPKNEKTAKAGKYINSPQTEIYDKSRVLFGLDQAKKAIREQDWTLIVEGQMDVIISHQHGFKNVVASSGTALSRHQLLLLKRYSDKIALAFDMDKAGELAADRGIKEAMALDMRIKVIILPTKYKDPADCLQSDPEAFREAISQSKPMMEYYFDKVLAERNLQNLEEKREVSKILLKMISKLASQLDQDFWIKRLSEIIDVSEAILREEMIELYKNDEANYSNQEQSEPKAVMADELSRPDKLSELLLSLLIKFPGLIPHVITNFDSEYLPSPVFKLFYKNLVIYYNKSAIFDYDGFRTYLKEQTADEISCLNRLTLLGERDYYNLDQDQAKAEIINSLSELKRHGYQQKIRKLERQISLAEEAGQGEEIEKLMKELKELNDNLKGFFKK